MTNQIGPLGGRLPWSPAPGLVPAQQSSPITKKDILASIVGVPSKDKVTLSCDPELQNILNKLKNGGKLDESEMKKIQENYNKFGEKTKENLVKYLKKFSEDIDMQAAVLKKIGSLNENQLKIFEKIFNQLFSSPPSIEKPFIPMIPKCQAI